MAVEVSSSSLRSVPEASLGEQSVGVASKPAWQVHSLQVDPGLLDFFFARHFVDDRGFD